MPLHRPAGQVAALAFCLAAGCGEPGPGGGPTGERGDQPATDPLGDYVTAWGHSMLGLPPGDEPRSFLMGGGRGDPDGEYTDHPVTLTRRFWLSRTEVTQAQWAQLSDNAEWAHFHVGCAGCPAESLTWLEAALYADALSAAEGLEPCYAPALNQFGGPAWDYDHLYDDPYACEGYRLPTEAEWEYAARAGIDTEFSGSDDVDAVAWYNGNAAISQVAATKAANGWGLHDMSGNVWEWTNDLYDVDYYDYSPGVDPAGPDGSWNREPSVVRGGYWGYGVRYTRVAYRYPSYWFYRYPHMGFRLARLGPAP